MVTRRSRRTLVGVLLALTLTGCAGHPQTSSPSANAAGILMVGPGERVQSVPPNEAMATALSTAQQQAEANGKDLGYPWIDPATGELVLSAVTAHGRELIASTAITVPHRVRDVTHGAAELRHIQDDVTLLGSQDFPGAQLIYQSGPDQRDDRVLIVISASSDELVAALAGRYPPDALAVEVQPLPSGGPQAFRGAIFSSM